MEAESLQKNRIMELVFIDVGQGDGCLLVTPDDRHLIIDAGQEDNMFRFLSWRYGSLKKKLPFQHQVVITHPDADHYYGFRPIFKNKNFDIGAVYHNGIVEVVGDKLAVLGNITTEKGVDYFTDLIRTTQEMKNKLASPQTEKKQFANLLRSLVQNHPQATIQMVNCEKPSKAEYLPGFGPGNELTIRVLGPVVEKVKGQPALRGFLAENSTDVGKTKNGHSVILLLEYKKVRVLLGGDLNSAAETFLLATYGGDKDPNKSVKEAKKFFGADVAKSCHHGSHDFTIEFMQAINPVATVISSGDEEPHAHPRPDTIGSIGLTSRAPRPLIFSTELARSAPELPGIPGAQLRQRYEYWRIIENKQTSVKDRLTAVQALQQMDELFFKDVDDQRQKAWKKLADPKAKEGSISSAAATIKTMDQKFMERSIATYGAINMRTDGDKVLFAYKIEKPSRDKKWDIYTLSRDDEGKLMYDR